jgi:hypothetical protein
MASSAKSGGTSYFAHCRVAYDELADSDELDAVAAVAQADAADDVLSVNESASW